MTTKERKPFIRSTIRNKREEPHYSPQGFPKDLYGIAYFRVSTISQMKRSPNSFDQQTEGLEELFSERYDAKFGGKPITDDEGISGTKGIHERPGLTKLMRLIEGKNLLENGEKLGWFAIVDVNRLTRDEWLITAGQIMQACAENGVIIVTPNMIFDFSVDFCKQFFIAKAQESASYLKWQKTVMRDNRQRQSDRGERDGRHAMMGYIFDLNEYLPDNVTPNPRFKKYIVYGPHAKVVKWLYERFLQLNGNIRELYREIRAHGYLFPAFKDVDQRNITSCSMYKSVIKDGPYKGCYLPSLHGLMTLMTNPVYKGCWTPMNNGKVENNHDRIVSDELFDYAYKRIAYVTEEGERQKPARVTRSGKADSVLKLVITGADEDKSVYAVNTNGLYKKGEAGIYVCSHYANGIMERDFTCEIETIDTPFIEKFLDKLTIWHESGELEEWKEKVKATTVNNEEKKEQIRKSIKFARAKMANINNTIENDDPLDPMEKEQKDDLKARYKGHAATVRELEKELSELEKPQTSEEQVILHDLWSLIPKIKKHWHKVKQETRLTFVGAFVRRAVLERPSSGWLKLTIEWKIGERDVMHVRRDTHGGNWKDEENAIIAELYPGSDVAVISQALPDRSWHGIRVQAMRKGIARTRRERKGVMNSEAYQWVTLEDMEYAQKAGLVPTDKNIQWS